MNEIDHQLNRQLRFEAGSVTSEGGYPNMSSTGRGYPRTEVATTLPDDLIFGQQTIMLSGGDNDYPITIGVSPWVT